MPTTPDKPRVRIKAGRQPLTQDSFNNFSASLGYGANNLSSGANYGFNPVTRNRVNLSWAYRGSWIVKQIVDAPADDMTRAGISIDSSIAPDDIEKTNEYLVSLNIWQSINEWIKWSRLYGGALAYIVIEGQDPSKPLRMETIGKDQFKGLMIFDRWMVWPHLQDTVTEFGPHFGKPKYYDVVADAQSTPRMKMHYSRVLTMDGLALPYWERMAENGWGMSVLEPVYDRILAFDSATTGAAQLIYRAHLRTLKIEKYRELIAFGGKAYEAMMQQIKLMRLMQTNEGLTVLDAADSFESHSYTFAGLSEMLDQFGTQLSGASQIPLTRLFGQSPSGMSSTGESDMRNYYDSIKAQQESRLRSNLTIILQIAHRSLFGYSVPKGFTFSFNPLWQMTDTEKGDLSSTVTTTVNSALEGGLVSPKIALQELRQSSKVTGIWSNISDRDIDEADSNPPPVSEATESAAPDGGGPSSPAKPPAPPEHSPDQPPPMHGEPKAEDAAIITPPSFQTKEDVANHYDTGTPKIKSMKQVRRHFVKQVEPTSVTPTIKDIADVKKLYPDPEATKLKTIADVRKFFNELIEEPATSTDTPENSKIETNKPNATDTFEFHFTDSRLSIKDIHGIPCVIETAKGERRLGYGWSNVMPVDYGYIMGTGSPEGGNEQTDVFIGDDTDSEKVWVIEQVVDIGNGNKRFDEYKVMLGFSDKDAALHAYLTSYSDDAAERIGSILSMDIPDLKKLLAKYPYKTERTPKQE